MQLFAKNIPLDTDPRSFRRRIAKELFIYNGERIPFRVTLNMNKIRRQAGRVDQKGRGASTARLVLPDEGPNFVFFVEDRFFRQRFTYRKTVISFAYDRFGDFMAERSLGLMLKEEILSDYGDDDDGSGAFSLKSVGSGAWDGMGRYLELWRSSPLDRPVPPTNTILSLELHMDSAQLEVRVDHGSVFFTFSSIMPSVFDRNSLTLFLVIASPPTFVQTHDTRTVQQEVVRNGRHYIDRRLIKIKLDPPRRQVGLGLDACKEMQSLSWVYALRFTSIQDYARFMPLWLRRFAEPDMIRVLGVRDNGAIRAAVKSDLELLLKRLPFEVAFQAQALVASWHLLPHELLALEDTIMMLDPPVAVERLKSLKSTLGWRDPLDSMSLFTVESIKARLLEGQKLEDGSTQTNDLVLQYFLQAAKRQQEMSSEERILIHSVKLTPMGMMLEGPYEEVGGNRVIREYPGTNDHYLRVSICDEDGGFLRDNNGMLNIEDVLYRRFEDVLRQGITVGGRRWDFLAFSSSQLRAHSCWFVRSLFLYEGKQITAQGIRNSIGDLDRIRCPPRFAARLGQAFTTTLYGVDIEESTVRIIPDIKARYGGYIFSDGVGTISREVVDMLNAAFKSRNPNAKKDAKDPCSVFQVRIGGAKGVLALDTRLKGRQVCLRRSMIKFDVKAKDTIKIEIAERCSRPLPLRLNRPLIPLLESLGVPYRAFQRIQAKALEAIKTASCDAAAGAKLLREYKLGDCVHLGRTLRELNDTFGLSFIKDVPFIREAMKTAMTFALRQLKYTHRIRVDGSCSLMGIMDETGLLQENQIYACVIPKGGSRTYLKGKCLVFRSPTLHPGDVQFAEAVGKLDVQHPLSALTNCVIFSRHGERPLPSKLAGGDLDGDLYNICFESSLFPANTYQAADYTPVKPVEIDRSVEVDDIIDFFLDHTQQNKVGLISTRHLVLSDQSPKRALDPDCLVLAELHSTAVDYPKTGHFVEFDEIPKALSKEKPDFMEDEYRVENRATSKTPRMFNGYYPSQRALGKLFRNIDVPKLLHEWGLGIESTRDGYAGSKANQKWEGKLLVALEPAGNEWMATYESHRKLVGHYYDYAAIISNEVVLSSRRNALTEAETFLTCVIGKSPVRGSVKASDMAEAVRERLRTLVRQLLTAAIAYSKNAKVKQEASRSRTKGRGTTPEASGMNGAEEAVDYNELAATLCLDEDDDTQAPYVEVKGIFEIDLEDAEDARSVITQSDSDDEYWRDIKSDDLASTTEGATTEFYEEDDASGERAAEREKCKIKERYYSLYSLFRAAVDTQQPERSSAPWVVFPRLVAAWREHRLASASA